MTTKAKRNAEMIDLRKRGMTVTELAKRFGVSKQRVCQLLPDGLGRKVTPSREKIEAMILNLWSVKDIASATGYSNDGMELVIKKYGLHKLYLSLRLDRWKSKQDKRDAAVNARHAGKKWNRLAFVKRVVGDLYLFKCDCGNIKAALLYNVTAGLTKSCGCRKKEYYQRAER